MSKRQAQTGRKRVTTKCRKCDSDSSKETSESPPNANTSINHIQVKKEVGSVETSSGSDQSSSSQLQTGITSSTSESGPPEGQNSTESDTPTVTFELEIDSQKREQVKSMLENLEKYGVVAKGATQDTLIVFDTVEKHGVRARVFNQPVRVLTSNTPTVTFEVEINSEKKRVDSKKRELIKSMVEYLERYGIVARGATQNTLIVFDTIEEHGILARVFKHKAIMIATSTPLPRRDNPISGDQKPQNSDSSISHSTDDSTTDDSTPKNSENSSDLNDSTANDAASTCKTGEITHEGSGLNQDNTIGFASTPDCDISSKPARDEA